MLVSLQDVRAIVLDSFEIHFVMKIRKDYLVVMKNVIQITFYYKNTIPIIIYRKQLFFQEEFFI